MALVPALLGLTHLLTAVQPKPKHRYAISTCASSSRCWNAMIGFCLADAPDPAVPEARDRARAAIALARTILDA